MEKGYENSLVTPCFPLVRLEGFEPPTDCLEGAEEEEGELGKSHYYNVISNGDNSSNDVVTAGFLGGFLSSVLSFMGFTPAKEVAA